MAAALPVAAQNQRIARLGVLGNLPPSDPREAAGWRSLIEQLKQLGWEEGRNLVIERRFAMNDRQKFPANAEELVAARVDVIYAPGDAAAAAAFRRCCCRRLT